MKAHPHIKEAFIQVEGHRLFYQEINPTKKKDPAPALIFLHDAIGSVKQWRGFPQKLAEEVGCPAIVYDRLGYGLSQATSEKRDKRYLEQEALERLPAFLDALELKDIVLMGHSDGGSIALIFAGQVPKGIRLRAIITEAAHVFVDDLTLAGIQEAVEMAKQSDFLKKLAKFHGNKTPYLFNAWHETWLSPAYQDFNIEAYLPKITCPSLIIQGEEDEYGTPAQVEAIVSQIKGPAQRLMIPNCAHVPHYQAEEVVLREMARFLKSA